MINYALIVLSALVLMLIFMPMLLPFLKKMKFGQTIYNLGPQAHKVKQGTPNMGGLLIGGITLAVTAVAAVIAYFVDDKEILGWDSGLYALLFICLGSMAIGFADDFIKDVKKRHDGLSPIQKIIGQIAVGAVFSTYCYFTVGSQIALPFTQVQWDLGVFYIPLMTLLVMFMTNSANLQDGVDGLLSSVTIVGMAAFAVLALFLGNGVLALKGARTVATLSFALVGACIGFLRFNRHPAKIFMGDTGSMFIGGAMVGGAMLLKMELWLIPICFTCIMSSVSVILQRVYFKLSHGKRIFKMSPIHHHFELSGMTENQIVVMYAAVTFVLSLLAILAASIWF